jgi:hypothetical protein
LRSRAGRFATDIENIGAVGYQLARLFEGFRACSKAFSMVSNWPPSENESGVVLMTPMT